MARKRPNPPPITPPPPPPTGVRLYIQAIGSLDNAPNVQAIRMFSELGAASWPMVLDHTSGVILRSTALRSGLYSNRRDNDGDHILSDHLAFCKRRGIEVYVNVPTRYQCDGRDQLLTQDLEQFARMKALGLAPTGYQIQSWGSGAVQSEMCQEVYEKANSLAPRIADVLTFLDAAPPGRLIIADTLAAKTDGQHNADWDYQRDGLALVEAMVKAGHQPPSFHQAWAREEAADDLSDVIAADRFYRSNGLRWGLKPISDAANKSPEGFFWGLVGFVEEMRRRDCLPDELTVTSWNRVWPKAMTPENEFATLTHAARAIIASGIIAKRT